MDPAVEETLKNFPPGPLCAYRSQASFCWKKMGLTMQGADAILLKHKIWSALEKDPLFAPPEVKPTFKDYRHLSLKRMQKLMDYDFLPLKVFMSRPEALDNFVSAIGQYDWSSLVKYQLLINFAASSLIGMGTERHLEDVQRLLNREIGACFCLTEIAHGTNTKAMRTTATYDVKTKEFILHTPDFQAAKCWAGNLGETATHAVVFATLITPDGENHGLHAFFAQIRDMTTFENLPGVSIGDMGEKIGLNGVDNGVMMFDHFRVPRETLLNRNGDINDEGVYVSPIKNKKKRLGASLGALSAGRVGIASMCTTNLIKAITIAIRYSAIRRQFGPDESKEELPVIEYQLQQWRLFPYVAASYVLLRYTRVLRMQFAGMQSAQMKKTLEGDKLATMGGEIHAMSSCAKPLTAWIARDAIQECREACGGHGYLAASGFGSLREDNDANCTYEGDNNVLLQQTANWLLNIWIQLQRGEDVIQFTPLGSASYIKSANEILKKKCTLNKPEDWLEPQAALDAYQFIVCYLLRSTANRIRELTEQHKLDLFTAKNEAQAYYYRPLSIAYGETLFVLRMVEFLQDPALAPEIRAVLKLLTSLFANWSLEKHASVLNQGGYFNEGCISALHASIEQMCTRLKPEAVALVDAIAPSDFALNSALGHSDGQVYKHLEERMAPSMKKRPEWWQEIVQPPATKAKL